MVNNQIGDRIMNYLFGHTFRHDGGFVSILSRTLLGSIFLLTVVACASTPTASGYLDNYERLKAGQHLERFWGNTSAIHKTVSPKILIGEISVDMISDKKGVTVDECVTWLRTDLKKGDLFVESAADPVAKIDLAITFMDPGSATARIMAGELGAGHAQVQVEGKVTDIGSGTLLATFAERGDASGYIGLQDLGGDAGPIMIKHMIEHIAEAINSELEALFSYNTVR